MIALGIILGEGYPVGRGKGVGIRVGMCDRKVVGMVARSWGTSVFMDRRKKPASHQHQTTQLGITMQQKQCHQDQI